LLTTNYEPKSGAPRLAIDPTKNSSLFEVPITDVNLLAHAGRGALFVRLQ
jgi:hypothetical protein